jgi:hypothetical protein
MVPLSLWTSCGSLGVAREMLGFVMRQSLVCTVVRVRARTRAIAGDDAERVGCERPVRRQGTSSM